ncbi:MAG: glycosyltransferase family 4 protein, partial [Micrococcaceae bacterium]|nr:glycosyltransferase family 4 protein [Micrococcaceae bacterium]
GAAGGRPPGPVGSTSATSCTTTGKARNQRTMHIVMFTDQHPGTLGGMQTSVQLQRKYLERAGHRVTVVAPALRGRAADTDPRVLTLPTIGLGPGEYGMTPPTARIIKTLVSRLRARGPVDLHHVQADFWGAAIGYAAAGMLGVPVVHTMHNHLQAGLRATMPLPGLFQRGFGLMQKRVLRTGEPVAADAWTYLRGFASRAAAVTAPSTHFAELLKGHGVCPRLDVIPTGLDDDVARGLLAEPRSEAHRARPRLVWIGRFSAEKRLIPFLRAVGASGIRADVRIFGDGAERRRAERIAADITASSITFQGRVPYERMLSELRHSDALVQTSQGFETQGMTVYEAAALGTPTVLSDHRIAADLPRNLLWLTDDDTVEGLARTLRRAAADLQDGRREPLDAAETGNLLQSRQTELMLAVYRRVLDGATPQEPAAG